MYQTLVKIRSKLASMKVIFLFICISMIIHLGWYLHDIQNLSTRFRAKNRDHLMKSWHNASADGFFSLRVIPAASKLGGILFDQEQIPKPNPNANRKFVVLVWKHWAWLKKRHVFNFGKPGDKEKKLLEDCSVNNCIFSGNDSLIDTADAVVVHLQRGLVPKVKNRNREQRWIFLNDESPRNAFSLAKKKLDMNSLYNVFNWSMTYRSDADVPVPYGRTLPLEHPLNSEYKSLQDIAEIIPNWKRKNRGQIAVVLMSNCKVKARNDFLEKLRKHIKVDVYGGCSDIKTFKRGCPGHFKADCDPVAEYLFYLVLENASCYQYLTEKVFYHAYAKGAIPVIFGPAIEDIESLLPPNSYLHADSEKVNIQSLARDMNELAANTAILLSMHMWRNHFKIVNEHGYFGTKSYHLCRLCEALNYNDETEKIYDKELLGFFLDPSRTCY